MPCNVVQHRWINWLLASKQCDCWQFEGDGSRIIEATAKSDTESQLQAMSEMMSVSNLTVQLGGLLLLSLEMLFSVLSYPLTEFLYQNATALQEVLGCLEHTGVVTQLIREVCAGKVDLVVLWLDLTNMYGSIPHKLLNLRSNAVAT